MPLTEIDANVSRHDSISRSSNISGKGSLKDGQPPRASLASDGLTGQAGVLSMLKTTTEIGDIGAPGSISNRLPQIPYGGPRHQPGIAPSRTSSHYSRAGSLKSKSSIRSKASDHSASDRPPTEAWPYSHYPHSGSFDLTQQHNESFAHQSFRSPAPVAEQQEAEQRSYSLTRVPAPLQPHRSLSKHRSATSLRSHGPAVARPRSPFMYPTRLRRPGFRPGSPALSDTNGASYNRPLHQRQGPGAPTFNGLSTPPPGSYEQQSPFAIPRPTQVPRQYTPAQFHNPSLHGYVRSQKAAVPESRFQQRPTNQVFHAPTPPYSRFQQPTVFIPSPLSNGGNRTSSAEASESPRSETNPQLGFVQRVKQALEERSSIEGGRQRPKPDSPKPRIEKPFEEQVIKTPGSPVVVKRLTRDMIKAAVGPSSDAGAVSSPDAADYLQAEDSTTGGSSIRADPSLELQRSTPDRTIEFAKYISVSPSDQNLREPESQEPQNVASARKEIDLSHNSLSDPPTDPSIVINSPSSSNGSLSALYLPKPVVESDSGELATNRLLHLTVPTDHLKKHASLPQPKSVKIESAASIRQSLPAPLTGYREDATLRNKTNTETSDLAQNGTSSPKPTAETDGCVNAESMLAATTAQPPIQIASHHTAENETASSVTSIVKVVRHSTAPRLEYATELSGNFETSANRFRNAIEMVAPSIESNVATNSTESRVQPENGPPSLSSTAATINDRFSAMKQFHFPLPDLAEDSQEDSSTTNLKMLGSKPPNFRSAGFKQAKREHRVAMHGGALPPPPASYVSRKLINTRNMPSLHFSQIDLTTKLNLALNVEPSNSAESPIRATEEDAADVSLLNGADQTPKRQRYKSFFSGVESVDDTEDMCMDLSEKHESQSQNRQSNNELVYEIDRLSIPSVNGLTLRLSQLLPAIKKCDSDVDLEAEEPNSATTNEDTGETSDVGRTGSSRRREKAIATTLTTGSVAKLRRSTHGLQDVDGASGLEKSISRLMKELPPLPGGNDNPIRRSKLSQQTDEHDESMPAELEATVPISNIKGESQGKGSQDNRLARSSKDVSKTQEPAQSIAGTSDSRPWNASSNYPWNESSPEIEISPLQSERNGQSSSSHVRLNSKTVSKTQGLLSRTATERIVRSMSPGPHGDKSLVPQRENDEDLEQIWPNRAGLIGSLQRKIGKKSRIDKASFPIDPLVLNPEERVTEPGDRYPTTGLTPPSHSNVEEAQSYFSDDSSDHDRPPVSAIRKRLTRLRHRQSGSKRSAQLRSISQAGSYSPFPHSGFWTGIRDSLSDHSNRSGSNPNIVAVYDQPLAGMSKFEYRAKRFVEKLRIFWCRSGNAIRSMSRARKHPQIWYEPAEVYEGV